MQNFHFSTGRVGSIPRRVEPFASLLNFDGHFIFSRMNEGDFMSWNVLQKFLTWYLLLIVLTESNILLIWRADASCVWWCVEQHKRKKWRFVLYIQCHGEGRGGQRQNLQSIWKIMITKTRQILTIQNIFVLYSCASLELDNMPVFSCAPNPLKYFWQDTLSPS